MRSTFLEDGLLGTIGRKDEASSNGLLGWAPGLLRVVAALLTPDTSQDDTLGVRLGVPDPVKMGGSTYNPATAGIWIDEDH